MDVRHAPQRRHHWRYERYAHKIEYFLISMHAELYLVTIYYSIAHFLLFISNKKKNHTILSKETLQYISTLGNKVYLIFPTKISKLYNTVGYPMEFAR